MKKIHNLSGLCERTPPTKNGTRCDSTVLAHGLAEDPFVRPKAERIIHELQQYRPASVLGAQSVRFGAQSVRFQQGCCCCFSLLLLAAAFRCITADHGHACATHSRHSGTTRSVLVRMRKSDNALQGIRVEGFTRQLPRPLISRYKSLLSMCAIAQPANPASTTTCVTAQHSRPCPESCSFICASGH